MKTTLFTAACAAFLAMPALAEIVITDAYTRASHSRAGAAFLTLENTGEDADHLLDVRSDAAARVELHSHEMNAEGVMRMVHVETGFALPAGEALVLERGGHHVMFMGLAEPWKDGDTIPVTLIFEKAGAVELEIPVDLSR